MKTKALFLTVFFCLTAQAEVPANYESLSAEQKQSILWKNISEKPYAELPALTGPDGSKFAFSFKTLDRAFTNKGDEFQTNRIKVIHQWGSAVKVEFKTSGNTPYTGLFKDGAVGIARLSLALAFVDEGDAFVPGMAVKFLVDGQPSQNIFVMEKLEGQKRDTNWFKETFTNILPNPASFKTWVGQQVFEQFVEDAIHLNVNHVASVTRTGQTVDRPVAPFQLLVKPAVGLKLPSDSADFRKDLATLPAGTVLYDVFGKDTSAKNSVVRRIGQIVTTSEFVSSEYEDKLLYFQHAGAKLETGWIRGLLQDLDLLP